jgi:hypothetical protein
MRLFNVTYEMWADEDVESGDPMDCGFAGQGMRLREALDSVIDTESNRCHQTDFGASDSCIAYARWFTVCNSADYETGIAENRSLHLPEGLTESTKKRIFRAMQSHY